MLHEAAARDAEMRKFIDRRIAELGVDINSQAQLVEMSGNAVLDTLGGIQHRLSVIAESGSAGTPINSGEQLDAVVSQSEAAAERILGAAEKMRAYLLQAAVMLGGTEADVLSEIAETEFSAICEACCFQDVTGQKVHGAVVEIGNIAESLDGLLKTMGGGAAKVAGGEGRPKSIGQDDIDALFG